MTARTVATVACGIALLGHAATAQDLSRYRTYEMGSGLASVAAKSAVMISEAKTIHERPALLQELEWRPSQWSADSIAAANDPVDKVLFSFYNDHLFRVVVDYGHSRTEGMTAADLVDAISSTYGSPLAPPAMSKVAPRVAEDPFGTVVARWGSAPYSVVLYRQAGYRETFRLTVTATDVDDLARKAAAQAARLDQQEAPSREIARQKKEKADVVAAADIARIANKKAFRP